MTAATASHVLFPTDLVGDEPEAWAHALRIAAAFGATLSIAHVRPPRHAVDPERLPRVAATLRRWGLVPDGTSDTDAPLGVTIGFDLLPGDDPAAELVEAADEADLVVMQAHGRIDRLDRALHPSVSERVARSIRTPSLVLPPEGRGFVDRDTGRIHVARVLIAVAGVEDQLVVDTATSFVAALGVARCHGRLVHVGDRGDLEALDLDAPGWTWDTVIRRGGVAEAVAAEATTSAPDLVVIGTHGHDSVLDAVFGSRAERVLHRVDRPVLIVPLRGW